LTLIWVQTASVTSGRDILIEMYGKWSIFKGVERFFRFAEFGTTYRRETLAGVTTFLTLAYIIIVNPAILAAGGIPREASTTATILAAAFGTIVMAFLANRPFAIAPYMCENAFVAYTVVGVMGLTWQMALAAVFLAGVIFIILTVTKLRKKFAESIPLTLKYSFAVGMGIFLAFIGFNETGLVRLGVPGAPVTVGDMTNPAVLLAIFCIILIGALLTLKVRGAILIGMLVTTGLYFIIIPGSLPQGIVSAPPSLAPVFGKLDLRGALSATGIAVVVMIFVMAFVDTIGTLLGLSARANLLDDKGNLPNIDRPMLADAIATTVAPVLGTTTTGAYIESAAGIEEGGRTGFTALVVAGLFLLALFLAPLLTVVPAAAYGSACIIVGSFMIASVRKIDFDDYTELIPAFLTITLMSFTYNIGIGMTAGFITWPLLKLLTGRVREVNLIQWLLAALSLVFYLLHPF